MADFSKTELLRETSGEVPAALRLQPVLLAVPSVLLGVGAIFDAWVSPLHSLAPAIVGVIKGVAWGVYFRNALRSAGGVATSTLLVPVSCMILAMVAYEYGDWGVLLPMVIWLVPLIDYAVMYGEGPDGALGGIIDTVKEAPVLWLGTMLGLLTGLVMLGLVLSLPASLYFTNAHREGAWLASVIGGALLGPFVHVALVFRARLFLAMHGDPA